MSAATAETASHSGPSSGLILPPTCFVAGRLSEWPEIADTDPPPDPDTVSERINKAGGAFGWTVQTFLRLKRRGHRVRLTDRFVPGTVCVVGYDDVHLKRFPVRSFLAVIQPDRPRPYLCDLRIVQNPRQVVDPATDFYMPYWPQPGLIPREPSRGDRVERVGFVGRGIYLAEPFRSAQFRQRLADLGMELVIKESDWRDYSDLDAVLAVRGVTAYDLTVKPASKLINAWHADCPALLGAEPAYRAYRKSELDYFEVATPEEAFAALRRLKEDPGLYRSMIANGQERRREVTPEVIAERWEQLLAGPISERFKAWRRFGPLRSAAAYPYRAVRHKLARREHFRRL